MSVISTITQVGMVQLEQLIRLEQFIVVFSRNLMILMLTPLFTLSIFEAATCCYRLLLRLSVGKLDANVATLRLRTDPWRLNYRWASKKGREAKRPDCI